MRGKKKIKIKETACVTIPTEIYYIQKTLSEGRLHSTTSGIVFDHKERPGGEL
jgi:hypothetical protein